MSDNESVIYSVPVPYAVDDEVIEVYGDPDMCWYEWRVVHNVYGLASKKMQRKVLKDSKDVGYGNAAIAMRDALIEVTKDL